MASKQRDVHRSSRRDRQTEYKASRIFTPQVLPAEFFWSINISGYLGYNIFQAYIDFLMEVLLCVM